MLYIYIYIIYNKSNVVIVIIKSTVLNNVIIYYIAVIIALFIYIAMLLYIMLVYPPFPLSLMGRVEGLNSDVVFRGV